MNVEQTLRDKRLLGGLDCFRDLTTWAAWLTFTRAVFGFRSWRAKFWARASSRSCCRW
jgi:hypothetical protein